MSIVVIGRNGQIARAVMRRAERDGRRVASLARPDFDLAQPHNLAARLKELAPEVVINAAAYTAVDQAESQPDLAFAVNARGAGAVAEAAAEIGAALVHLSTDYVFSGAKTDGAYAEDDEAGPISAYGESKLEGERLVLAAHPRAIVLRTSWVYDASGSNFVRTMLRLARTRDKINVVNDQIGRPTYTDDLAEIILDLAGAATRNAAPDNILHCAGGGETTWADYAREVFALSRARGGPAAEVVPIPTKDYPSAAQRPLNSRLDCTRLRVRYGLELRPWREALAECIDEIAAQGWSVE